MQQTILILYRISSVVGACMQSQSFVEFGTVFRRQLHIYIYLYIYLYAVWFHLASRIWHRNASYMGKRMRENAASRPCICVRVPRLQLRMALRCANIVHSAYKYIMGNSSPTLAGVGRGMPKEKIEKNPACRSLCARGAFVLNIFSAMRNVWMSGEMHIIFCDDSSGDQLKM